jgi:hypothetical protein
MDGPLGCDVALLELVLQLLQLGLQFWIRVSHGVEFPNGSAACGDQVERMCAMAARDMSRQQGRSAWRKDGVQSSAKRAEDGVRA